MVVIKGEREIFYNLFVWRDVFFWFVKCLGCSSCSFSIGYMVENRRDRVFDFIVVDVL